MIDWASRIDELSAKIAHDYAVDDPEAIGILLSGLVECPRTEGSWIVLETNWYQRECDDAWFSFGELWSPCSLPRLRARYPWREIESEMKQMLDSPVNERLFVEPDYERYPIFSRLTQAQYLLQRSLRVRTRSARTAQPAEYVDRHARARRNDELQAVAQYALEDRAQARSAEPPRFIEPPNFLYYLELLQKLAPWYPDWHILVRSFALIAVRHAHLYGRNETGSEEHRALARIVRDSIPPWIAKALRALLEGPVKGIPLEAKMQLEEKTRRSGHGAARELTRLQRAGIITWKIKSMHWEIAEQHREGVRRALEGRIFGVNGAAAGASR